MANYDSWKTATPYENEKDNECLYCGNPCDGMYCSKGCKRADLD